MAEDLFSKYGAQKLTGYRLAQTVLTIGSVSSDLVATGFSFTYTQPVDVVDTLNADRKIVIAGQPSGSGQIGLLIGPSSDIETFIRVYSDVCALSDSTQNYIILKPANTCKDVASDDMGFRLSGVIINSLGSGLTRSANGNIIVANIGFTFMRLEPV